MRITVPRETFPGERRVALIPASVPVLVKAGMEVAVEKGAGSAAGFTDEQYEAKGAKIVADRNELFSTDVVLQIRISQLDSDDKYPYRSGQVVIGMADPLNATQQLQEIGKKGITLFSLELIPRSTRAQSMDVLSSMATIVGYKAVLMAADRITKIFPMLMTAAGTVNASKVFVIGAGVAGLQAIATAKRLGAVVSAYDVRPAVKEQIQSLGGKFVELELETNSSEDKGGYAQEMGEEFYRKQRELLTKVASESDAIISTAAIPGKKAPLLITSDAVARMTPGSVIVDLAGNCELTKMGETVVENSVTIVAPSNPASEIPTHASQMYSKNISNFLLNLVKDGKIEINLEDEIIADTLVLRDGEMVNSRIQQLLTGK